MCMSTAGDASCEDACQGSCTVMFNDKVCKALLSTTDIVLIVSLTTFGISALVAIYLYNRPKIVQFTSVNTTTPPITPRVVE